MLTETGAKQAEKCRDALANMKFDVCFSSPISRAKVPTIPSLLYECDCERYEEYDACV